MYFFSSLESRADLYINRVLLDSPSAAAANIEEMICPLPRFVGRTTRGNNARAAGTNVHPAVSAGGTHPSKPLSDAGLRPRRCTPKVVKATSGERTSSKRTAAAHARSRLGCRAKLPSHIRRNGKIYAF